MIDITMFYTERHIKKVSHLREFMIKFLTKGNVFRYHNEPNSSALIEEAKRSAEVQVDETIRANWDSIPKRIKRDIEV